MAIVDSFMATLRGVYHPRIQYPKIVVVDALPIEAGMELTTDSSRSTEIPTTPKQNT